MALDVVISGAGIAGATLAYFLAKSGAHVTVVEKSPGFRAQGQNVDIHGSALEVVRRMGLLDDIRQASTGEVGTQFLDPEGRPYALFPVQKNRMSFTQEHEILRSDLAALLFKSTQDLPNVRYVFGTTIAEILPGHDGSVQVKLSNGTFQRFDVVVLADGQWSKLRKKSFSPEILTVVNKNMYVAHCTVPRLHNDQPWWTIFVDLRSRIIATRPGSHGTTKMMISVMPCNAEQKEKWRNVHQLDREKQESLIRQEFLDAGWQAKRFLHEMHTADDFYVQAIEQIKMSRWFTSEVVCVGDSAYAPSPLTGMGTPLAILGGYILAGELSMLGKDEHPSVAFEAYERKLRPFVEQSQKIASFIPAVGHPATAWGRWLQRCFISAFCRIAAHSWLGRFFVEKEATTSSFPLPEYSWTL